MACACGSSAGAELEAARALGAVPLRRPLRPVLSRSCSASAAGSRRSSPAATCPSTRSIAASSTRCSPSRPSAPSRSPASGDLFALPRPRDDVARRLRADRLPPRLAPQHRGGGEVLPPRLVRGGAAALRRGARSTAPRATPTSWASAPRSSRAAGKVRCRSSSSAWCCVLVGLALQGERGALPHVDARRLRGRADAGHRLHGRRGQERRVRGAHARAPGRVRPPVSASWGAGWPPVRRACSPSSR